LSLDIVKEVFNNVGINLFCVATHYSERYGNADNYLSTIDEDDIKNYVLFFEKKSLHVTIINEFIGQCIEFSSESDINWKNMHYIWKLYLSSLNIPNMIYSQQLQEILMSRLQYTNDSSNLVFTNITSKYLPNVSSFVSFWDKHILITSESNIDDEYEIDELMSLYKNYDKKISHLNDKNMIKMIYHFYSPSVEIIDNKYVTNIKCNLWSKNDDVNKFLESYKFNKFTNLTNNSLNQNTDIISFDDLYQSYKNYINALSLLENKINLIVSKQFFEKYIINHLSKFIQFEKFVSSEWLLS
jgi:hypothetical protein